jgi:phytoene synthase
MSDTAVPPELWRAYARCRQLTRRHGSTYFWATQLLPARCRSHVYALYGFCRHADDIVDCFGPDAHEQRAFALERLSDRLHRALNGKRADPATDPVVAAVAHTAAAHGIAASCFDRFLHSMTMDLVVSQYETWDDLVGYMDGSAAVIGEMMLPILEPLDAAAFEPARDLGRAFQLTNFLRDVGEDLARGRVYLPQEDLRGFGADPRHRSVTPAWRNVMRYEIERARRLYHAADRGITLLPARSASSIATARILYAEILDEIEAADYDVFTRRARVSTSRKVFVAIRTAARRAAGPRLTCRWCG